jgi:hypothetical protein
VIQRRRYFPPQTRARPRMGLGAIPFVHGPAEIRGLQEQLKSQTLIIDMAVRSCAALDQTTRAGWGAFYVQAQDASTEPVDLVDMLHLTTQFERYTAMLAESEGWIVTLTQRGCYIPVVAAPKSGPFDALEKVLAAAGGAAVTIGLVYGGIKLADVIGSRLKKK